MSDVEDEDDWEEEGWEEDEPDSPSAGAWLPAHQGGPRTSSSLALGFLAMVPMFCAYELGLEADPELARSQSEQALFRLLVLTGDLEEGLRRGLIVVGALVAAVLCYRRRLALVPSLMRIGVEGCFGALALGPALALLMRFFGGLDTDLAPPQADPGLAVGARVFGAAAFEELLFRVAFYGGLYVLARQLLLFFGMAERGARWLAEGLALLGSSAGFAAVHLAALTAWLGPQGEAFDPALFTWRFLAGILLALLFRWRGPGVAAWTHGLFNLALLIGAGPEVML